MQKHHIALITFLLFSSFVFSQNNQYRKSIDLSGQWKFETDTLNAGIANQYWSRSFTDEVSLPGTTDTNRKGKHNTNKTETTQLSRYYTYEGPAWYSKDVVVPADWANQNITLFLERTRPSMLWVDGVLIDSCSLLSSPHKYDLSSVLTPGHHQIVLRIDNGESIPAQIKTSSHACTESTQTNWNGIIGKMELTATSPLNIDNVQLYPLVGETAVRGVVTLSNDKKLKGKRIELSAKSFNSKKEHQTKVMTLPLKNGQQIYEFIYPLGDEVQLWSEYDPALYHLTLTIPGVDEITETFGMRDFGIQEKQFTINGLTTFLRGKHDACVFPLTGHTAMDVDEWRRYFRICKEYGLNHCRFHSWCPPKACFEAADLEGIYLQPELPIWGAFSNDTPELMDFLRKDGEELLKEYSNHPSFVMFALGNELWGEKELLAEFVNHFRVQEPRHHYAYGSNIYLGWEGHLPGEDFLVTCRVGGGDGYSTHARASFSFADADEGGYLNNTHPNTVMNFDEALLNSPVPVIGHETGQFQIYPDYNEIAKYTGVLAPWNFEEFKRRLHEKGMGHLAEEFHKASGAWSMELYRADVEMNLRTDKMAGFQLLDLQDYPGQGSAYVGVLDAFMDSKGLIKPDEWRNFCSEVVPLLIADKYCWTNDDAFHADIKLANYGSGELYDKMLVWEFIVGDATLRQGTFRIPKGRGLLNTGNIDFSLDDITKPVKAGLKLSVPGTDYQNSYPLWVYPEAEEIALDDIYVTNKVDEALQKMLMEGNKVLLMPDASTYADVTVGGLFQTDYWNYRMFKTICENAGKPVSPGTLGILTDPSHPLFNAFPTDSHTSWQWYPVLKESNPMTLDELSSNYFPIVQVIDNVERNHKLGLIFEFSVGNGSLLVCMSDLNEASQTTEGKQFYRSLLNYIHSDEFQPKEVLTYEELQSLFTSKEQNSQIKTLRNISYD